MRVSLPMTTTARCLVVSTRPAARPSASMNSAVIGDSPARPRMPSVPKYFFCVIEATRSAPCARSHRIRRAVGCENAGEYRFDFGARGFAVGGIVELHADPRRAVSLCAGGRDPHDLARDRKTIFVVHQREQEKNFIAERVALRGRHEQPAAAHIRHVRVVERTLVLDRQRQDALPRHAPDRTGYHLTHSSIRPIPTVRREPLVRTATVRAVARGPGCSGRTTALAW